MEYMARVPYSNIDECGNGSHGCVKATCIDTEGSYECKCWNGYSGNATKDGTGCIADQDQDQDQSMVVKIALSSSVAAILLIVCLQVKGDERPTMKEVAMELEGILASMIQKHPWVQHPSNEDEAEYLLREPTNGFECTDGASGNSSTFDSMGKHTILQVASGR
ncbi:hypothetical protein L2E82_08039 [Cichorium intybus]|uniref:Uncharacterized protein n=1 Tax=Cichorium intybus TaxID=13427 RepID=A0ACB9G5G0_CICIN|nr:hypothetical protein L2E82_08039 [Cichorium intybus]